MYVQNLRFRPRRSYNHRLYAWYKMLWLILIVALLVEPCPLVQAYPDARRLEGDGKLAGDYAGYYVGIMWAMYS